MLITTLFSRLSMVLFLLAVAFFLGNHLYQRIDGQKRVLERLELMQLKKERLEALAQKKRDWLSSSDLKGAEEIVDRLRDLRLCQGVCADLTHHLYHPFSTDASAMESLLDRLEQNEIKIIKNGDEYSLVEPVYMERKDLEKMIEIIENKGAFSPVEIKELGFKSEILLGGELWKVERLVFAMVDADGALP